MSGVLTSAYCDRMLWVSRFGRQPQCKGPCQNLAAFKDEDRLVCKDHVRKKRTKLVVPLRLHGASITIDEDR